jgi:diaminopimelate decarboxylase
MMQDAGSEIPRLPSKMLFEFVKTYFERRHFFLDAQKGESSPLYLLDTNALKTRAAEFMDAFEDLFPEVSFYYALKSNNHPEIARLLLGSGFGLDVSSGLELETALSLDAQNIVFSGPGKTNDELALAATHYDRVTVLIDSFGELSRLNSIAADMKAFVRAGVRLTTNPHGLWRKFGILPERLGAFCVEVQACEHVILEGIQFHTSWNLSPSAQIDFIRHLGKILGEMDATVRSKIRFIDIGGGYWPPLGEWLQSAVDPEETRHTGPEDFTTATTEHYYQQATPIATFAEEIDTAIKAHIFPHLRCRICFEPGRWVCNDAMHLLMSVVDKKAPDLVITDAGTNAVGWERFETDYFPVLNLTRPALTETPCHVLGSLCTPHDVWGYAYWGSGIEVGDILLIPTQGAYTYSLRQHFIKPLPRVVLI